ncbi:hypothetical protein COCON_G00035920 [Conger conger]|uniref:Uncharacterized protein n=1 Tax=Conger conger TaxID=82655 RepID=A0A9Q1I5U4_CONCO|nr:hypothetical protein COCON_G00035920 [Conger conger]
MLTASNHRKTLKTVGIFIKPKDYATVSEAVVRLNVARRRGALWIHGRINSTASKSAILSQTTTIGIWCLLLKLGYIHKCVHDAWQENRVT